MIAAEGGKFTITGSKLAPSPQGTYQFEGEDKMIWAWASGSQIPSYTFARVGKCEYPAELFVGKWETSFLSEGANWTWTVEFGRERNYHSHTEASDEGPFTAANGKWEMISTWNPLPIEGGYRISKQGEPQLGIWPFGWVTLTSSQKPVSN
jgi:hypothetical protein